MLLSRICVVNVVNIGRVFGRTYNTHFQDIYLCKFCHYNLENKCFSYQNNNFQNKVSNDHLQVEL